MKAWVLVFCTLIMLVGNNLAQNSQPTPTPPATQSSSRSGSQNQTNTQNQRQNDQEINAAFNNLRSLEIQQNAGKTIETILNDEIRPLYRKPSKKELTNLTPSPALLTKYDKFLQQSDTGIFKISADSTCAGNSQVVIGSMVSNCETPSAWPRFTLTFVSTPK